MSISCLNCQAQNPETHRFCGQCGSPLPPAEVSPPGNETLTPTVTPVNPNLQQASPEPSSPVATAENPSQPPTEHYALVSIEFMNIVEIASQFSDPETAKQLQEQCTALTKAEATRLGGQVESIRNTILFISFPNEVSLEESLKKTVQLTDKLIIQPVQLNGSPLKLRAGVSIENPNQKDPMTAAVERSVAAPGTVIFSPAARQVLMNAFEFETIGPIRIAGNLATFYQLKTNAPTPEPTTPQQESVSQPEPEPVMTPQAEEPQPEPPVQESVYEEPLPQEQVVRHEPSPQQPEPVSPPVQQAEPEPALPSSEPQAAPVSTPTPTIEELLGTRENLQDIAYNPPEYLNQQGLKPPNVNYNAVIPTLLPEFKKLLDDYGTNEIKPRGQIFHFLATEGVGKSYLVQLLRNHIDPMQSFDPNEAPPNPKAFWLMGQPVLTYHHEPLPLNIWINLIQSFFGLFIDGFPRKEGRDYINNMLKEVYRGPVPDDVADFFHDMLSVNPLEPISSNSRNNAGRIEFYLKHTLEALCRQKPVIIILDDIHECDTASLDVLYRLLKGGLLDLPIFLCFTSNRNTQFAGALGTQLNMLPYRDMVISDLNREEILAYLGSGPLAGQMDTFPNYVVDKLIDASKGLPLYMEEILRYLHMQEVLVMDEQSGKLVFNTEKGEVFSIPQNLEEMIAARIKYLPPDHLYLLQVASVLGEKFSLGSLMDLTQTNDQQALEQALALPWNMGLIVPYAQSTVMFKHRVFWKALYESIEPVQRSQIHGMASEYLESRPVDMAINPMVIAYHAEMAGLSKKAFAYWNMTGVFCTQVGSIVGSNLAFFKNLSLLANSSDISEEGTDALLSENMALLNGNDDPELTVRLLKYASHMRYQDNDTSRLLDNLTLIAYSGRRSGEYSMALNAQNVALSICDKDKMPQEYCSMLVTKLSYLYSLGRLEEGRQLIQNDILPLIHHFSQDKKSEYFPLYLSFLLLKGRIMLRQCEPGALDIIDEALSFADEMQLIDLKFSLSLERIYGQFLKGEYKDCNEDLQYLLKEIESYEDNAEHIAQWGLLAMMLHDATGDWENGAMLIPNCIYQAQTAMNHLTLSMINAYAAHITYGSGKQDEASQMMEQCIPEISGRQLATPSLAAWRFFSEIELATGNSEMALEVTDEALSVASQPGIQNQIEIILLTNLKARCLMKQGLIKEAGKLLEGHWPVCLKTGYPPLIAETAGCIGGLYKEIAQVTSGPLQEKHKRRSFEFFQKARDLWQELGNTYRLAQIQGQLATVG